MAAAFVVAVPIAAAPVTMAVIDSPDATAQVATAAIGTRASTASDIVVTASHFARAGGGFDASVVSPSDAPATATLGDLLAGVSDLTVQRPGGASGVGSVFIRGAKPNFTLVMIDGIPLNDPTNTRGGSADVSAIAAIGIAHVEVVRGSISSIYGSGAVAGAVNLILPAGSPYLEVTTTAASGSDASAVGGVLIRGPLGGAGGSLSLTYSDAGRATLDSSRVNAALNVKLAPLDGSDRYSLVVRVSRSDAQAFPDASGGPAFAVRRATEATRSEVALAGGTWRVGLTPRLDLALAASGVDQLFDDRSPGVAPAATSPGGVPPGTTHSRYDFVRGQAIVRWRADGVRVLAGAEVVDEVGTSQGALTLFGQSLPNSFELRRTTLAGFGEGEATIGPAAVEGSVRVDAATGFGANVSSRTGGSLRLGGGWTVRIAHSDSFKAPSFYSLGNAFVGNPRLRPEISESLEVGVSWRAKTAVVDVAGFRNDYADLISFVPGPPPRLDNLSAVRSQGVAASFTAPTGGRGTLTLSATYVDTRDLATGATLLDLPAWRGNAEAELRFTPRLRGRLTATVVGDRLSYALPTGTVRIAPYVTVATRLAWRATRAVDLVLDVEDVLDRRYYDAVGFRSPGAAAKVSLVVRDRKRGGE